MDPLQKPLSRAQALNALRRVTTQLPPAVAKAADQLFNLLDDDGSASVGKIHSELFPLAETKSASAQLSKLIKKIEEAAAQVGLVLSVDYSGAKQAGAANRKLNFLGPPPSLRADIETLNALPPERVIEGQTGVVLSEAPTVVLLTFNDHEYAAVRKTFFPQGNPEVERRSGISADKLGTHGGLNILHCHSKQANDESQRATTDIANAFQPRAVIAVGIAFGCKEGDQNYGETLVSEFICPYELAKADRDGRITPRGSRPPASRLLQKALHDLDLRRKNDAQHIGWPKLHFGGLLTGNKLIDNLNYRDRLIELAGTDSIVGGEMEASGIFHALDGKSIDWIIIKAICDFADGNKSKDKERRQKDAAANAAMVVKALLDEGGLYQDDANPPPEKRSRRPIEARQRLLEGLNREHLIEGSKAIPIDLASSALDDLKADADSGRGIVVFDDLLDWVKNPHARPLYALLGEYGMGKTITCQRFAEHLRQRRIEGEDWPQPLYFDLRKVERLPGASDPGHGAVPTVRETIEDCLRHGYLHDADGPPAYDEVLRQIDRGAVVIFDGLDEVLSRIGDKQGLRFTANLLKILPEAELRRQDIQNTSKETPRSLKVLLSCRSQFFRNLAEQNSHLTGEHRGAKPAEHYRAVVLQGFSDEQILAYFKAVFPVQDAEEVLSRIESVHNLRELAGRPFTLKLVGQFIPRIDAWRAAGKEVTGATLYREVAREWLIRDKEKQSFMPEDKELLASDLAGWMWRENRRGLSARELENWLGRWLATQEPTADFQLKPRELLQEDLRNSTFLKRSDGITPELSRFEFAHTSLQEFFLADYLLRALRGNQRTDWIGGKVSDETLDFLGQMLREESDGHAISTFSSWRTPYLARASELQLSYGLRAHRYGWPMPTLAGMDLRGATLDDWHFGSWDEAKIPSSTPLNLRHIDFQNTSLSRSEFWGVDITGAKFCIADLRQAEFLNCELSDAGWNNAKLHGAVFRDCHGTDDHFPEAIHYDTSFIANTKINYGIRSYNNNFELNINAHHNSTACAAISRKLRYFATAYLDNTVWLFDGQSGKCITSYTNALSRVRAISFSPNEKRLVFGCDDGSITIIEIAESTSTAIVVKTNLPINSIAISEDQRIIVACPLGSPAYVISTDSNQVKCKLSGHRASITHCCISPDSKLIATCGEDNEINIWSHETGECTHTLNGHSAPVTTCTFSADGNFVISVSDDDALRFWSLKNGKCVVVVEKLLTNQSKCALASHGNEVILFCDDFLERRSLPSFAIVERSSFIVPERIPFLVKTPVLSDDGNHVFFADHRGHGIWETRTGRCTSRIRGLKTALVETKIVNDEIVTATQYGVITRLNFETGTPRATNYLKEFEPFKIQMSPDSSRILVTCFHGGWRLYSGDYSVIIAEDELTTFRAMTPDGNFIFATNESHELIKFETATGRSNSIIKQNPARNSLVAVSPKGCHLITGSFFGDASFIENGENSIKLSPPRRVSAAEFSPSGNIFITESLRTLTIWDGLTWKQVIDLTGHTGNILCFAVSPSDDLIISGAEDSTLRLWKSDSGQCIHVLRGHRAGISSCSFSPDGTQVLSSSYDGTARLWDVATGACLRAFLVTPNGAAAWEPTTNRVLHVEGDAWRYLSWFGQVDGKPASWPLEVGPPEVAAA